ncbi:MAG: class I SAM-dependent methyltransferase [Elusimicrobia bacterium]|nr:class I SAM-dependent methyltransferase [Elusimicrobiota bacterium]
MLDPYRLLRQNYILEPDGVWAPRYEANFGRDSQNQEWETRKQYALFEKKISLNTVANYYSIPVMDHEIERFLKKLPRGAIIADIGAGRCWHWRRMQNLRPDLKILAADFCRENFVHAHHFLGPLINNQVFLIQADAVDLRFPRECIDAYWSAGSLQQLPPDKLPSALNEARRILKTNGLFVNYSTNAPLAHGLLAKLLGKKIHQSGYQKNFYLQYATNDYLEITRRAFPGLTLRYCEFLFYPGRFLKWSGRERSLLGRLETVHNLC